ncbi:ABC transporter ATP-binding protein [Actinomycetospora lutea]|uniref:ABC transporter ATP-binding protein n=1 Tax=Actinomycetospora lutea TaxID=663604 RepID=UPI0023673D20|nr:ABC transporter ATP-binding protein [Actinomycetospora lutea]MDD7939477.1 ABC transporter ATP-binding protein [Actinomycetospora lutea]
MTGVVVDGVAKAFGATPVLRGVSLTAPAGTLTAVLGRSGCGKTTLLRIVAGFERLDAGTVTLHGRPVAGPDRALPPERRGIGYLTQEGSLFPHLTVAANVLFGLPWRERRRGGARVAALLEGVDLEPSLARRHPHELSGGQQQRVALARALAPEPAVVLLDEPFSSLDAGLRADTQRAVVKALAAAGATALLVTHDRGEALALADQVAVMRDGVVAQIDAPGAIYRDPVDPGVGALVGDAVLLDGRRDGAGSVSCALGVLAVRPDRQGRRGAAGPVRVLVRPEQIVVGAGDGGVRARVRSRDFRGPDASVELDLGDAAPGTEIVTARLPGDAAVAPGDDVTVTVRGAVTAYDA